MKRFKQKTKVFRAVGRVKTGAWRRTNVVGTGPIDKIKGGLLWRIWYRVELLVIRRISMVYV